MQYHSFTTVLWSLITAVFKELEVRARERGPETKHSSDDDMGSDLIDSCGDTGPRCREGLKTRRAKRGDYCEALVDLNSGWGLSTCFPRCNGLYFQVWWQSKIFWGRYSRFCGVQG